MLFTEAFSKVLINAARENKNIVAVTAAMQNGTGLSAFSQIFSNRFFDVGIAEEHAVTFAAGLSAKGLKPVVAIYSTFIQRSVDQIIHDCALQKLPIILALDRSGFVDADGETHQGLFDIALFRSTPNTAILTPASENEIKLMFDWALEQSLTVIIRYPKAYCPIEADAFSLPVETGKGVWISKSSANVCLFFTGSLYTEILEASVLLKENGINADIYNLRFIKPVDEDYFTGIINDYELSVFIEEGILHGGFGEYALSLIQRRGCKTEALVLAVESGFLEEDRALGTRQELLRENNLDGKGISKSIISKLNSVMKERNKV